MTIGIGALPLGLVQERTHHRRETAEGESGTGFRIPQVTDGCVVHDACLTCPLPDCILGHPDYAAITKRQRDAKRNAEIYQRHLAGVPVETLGKRFAISPRTVHRIIRDFNELAGMQDKGPMIRGKARRG